MTRWRDGRKFHDGCDCLPVLVLDGKPWAGQKESEALYARWRQYTWDGSRMKADQFGEWSKAIAAGKIDPRDYSPLKVSGPVGKIVLNGVTPKAHELVTYETLKGLGHNVELRPVSRKEGVKSADCWVDGSLVEVKAPQGGGRSTVRDLLREGSRQAATVVVDLHRTELPLDQAIAQSEDALRRYNRLYEVVLISKNRKIVRRLRGEL